MAKKNEIICHRTDCTANMCGSCTALDKTVRIGSDNHTIDDKYIESCPFFLTKEQKARDYQYCEARMQNRMVAY